jgi:hypothetical protein
MKCTYINRRSTTVNITDFLLMRGKPLMKSMATSSHTAEGTLVVVADPPTGVVHLCSSGKSRRRAQIHAPSRARSKCGSLRGDDGVFSMPSCSALWACTRMAWSRGDVAMTKERPRTMMMPSMIRHAVPRSPACTADQSAVSSMCSARKSSKSRKDGVEMALSSLEFSVSRWDSASATVLVETGQYSTVKSNPRSLLTK